MQIMTIGATGFIGRHVVSQLLRAGHEVAVLHRGKTALPRDWQVSEFIGDRANLKDLGLRAWRPDVVIDMILSSAKQARATVDAFAGIARRVVAASSGDVYRAMAVLHGLDSGAFQPTPLTEDSELRAQGRTYPRETLAAVRVRLPWIDDEYDKIQVEQAISGHCELPATILRLPMVYGPGDMFRRFHTTLKRMLDSRPVILLEQTVSQWATCRGYVENVAQAIALAATEEKATGRIFNVADPDRFTEAEWAAQIGKTVGWNGRIIALPAGDMPKHLLGPGNHGQHLFMDSTRIRRELGYSETVPLSEAIRRTVEWEKANPPEEIDPAQFNYEAEDEAARLVLS